MKNFKRYLSESNQISEDNTSYKEQLDILVMSIRESFSSNTGYYLTEEQAEKAVKKYSKKMNKLADELTNLEKNIENIK